MCFSATASFASAGVLVGIGSIALARRRPAPLRLLAAVPLLFGLQQAAEGFVWQTLELPSSPLHLAAVQVFLAMALVLWPLLMPASLLLAEAVPRRRVALAIMLTLGAAVAAYGVASLLSPTSVSVRGCSLEYQWDSSMPWVVERLFGTAYLVAAVCPFLASSLRGSRAIGLAFVGAFGASILFWQATLPSVWCFFAAVLSILIVLGPLGDALPARLATAVLLVATVVPWSVVFGMTIALFAQLSLSDSTGF